MTLLAPWSAVQGWLLIADFTVEVNKGVGADHTVRLKAFACLELLNFLKQSSRSRRPRLRADHHRARSRATGFLIGSLSCTRAGWVADFRFPRYVSEPQEGCRSGRTGWFRKPVKGQPFRGFESPLLRTDPRRLRPPCFLYLRQRPRDRILHSVLFKVKGYPRS